MGDESQSTAVEDLNCDICSSRVEGAVLASIQILISGLTSAMHEMKSEREPSSINTVGANERLLRHPDVFYSTTFLLAENGLVTTRSRELLLDIRELLGSRIDEISRMLVDNDESKYVGSSAAKKDAGKQLRSASKSVLKLIQELKTFPSTF